MLVILDERPRLLCCYQTYDILRVGNNSILVAPRKWVLTYVVNILYEVMNNIGVLDRSIQNLPFDSFVTGTFRGSKRIENRNAPEYSPGLTASTMKRSSLAAVIML
jgi:hypothetical protein